jgi:flagellar motor switch protein FliN/FliY
MSLAPPSALPSLSRPPRAGTKHIFHFEELSGLALNVEVPLGQIELTLGELLQVRVGSILQLNRLTGETLELTVNGTPIAKGEVRVHGDRFAIRITGVLQSGGRGPLEGEEPHATPQVRR